MDISALLAALLAALGGMGITVPALPEVSSVISQDWDNDDWDDRWDEDDDWDDDWDDRWDD